MGTTGIFTFEGFLLIAGALLIVGACSSRLSSKFGVPALILFIFIGMLAGSEGPGGIYFDNYALANKLGVLALVLILFGGGLDTSWSAIRGAFLSGVSLATIGVAITAAIVGVSATTLFGMSPLEGLLLGAIVSSTDAAAVFGVLRAQNLRLKGNLSHLLELESGSNDPMAVFLTVGLTGLILNPSMSGWSLVPHLIQDMVLGAVIGWLVGRAVAWGINKIELTYDGLYTVITIGTALVSYAGAQVVGGNGFLSVYVAAVTLGSRDFVQKVSLLQFHEGIAWLMQVVMFISLGLLAFPEAILANAIFGIILSAILILIARPVAVMISLAFAKTFSFREKLFVSWVGLRGAVPIILATIPLNAGLPVASQMFNLVFFVVIMSVLIQGVGLRWFATFLNVISYENSHVSEKKIASTKLEVVISKYSQVIGKSVAELSIPENILLALVRRGEKSFIPKGNTVFEVGDVVLVETDKSGIASVKEIFATGK